MKRNLISIAVFVAIISICCIPYALSSVSALIFNSEQSLFYPAEQPLCCNSSLQTINLQGEQRIYCKNGTDILPALSALGYTQTVADTPIPQSEDEMRGVWIPYLSLYNITAEGIDAMVKNIKDANLNTVFFHVRPFGDALYNSSYFPWSHILTGTQGKAPENGFDPLEYAVGAFHKNNIKIHAWINPLRIRSGTSTPKTLAENNPAVAALNDKNSNRIINYNGSLYYNPCNEENIILIVNGIEEILQNYDVDGIHFDDYFYPTDTAEFGDGSDYELYTSSGGTLTLTEWRAQNINSLIKSVYTAVKKYGKDKLFGISPSGNINSCLKQGANIYEWGSKKGYVDYLCPQVYWSQINTEHPYEKTAVEWRKAVTEDSVKLYIGLALYKTGSNADNGTWQGSSNIADQIRLLRSESINANGFVLYSYAYLNNSATKEEINAIKKVL